MNSKTSQIRSLYFLSLILLISLPEVVFSGVNGTANKLNPKVILNIPNIQNKNDLIQVISNSTSNKTKGIPDSIKASLDSVTKKQAMTYSCRFVSKIADEAGNVYYSGYDGRTNKKITNFHVGIDIGSCSKMFTATAVMQLIEQGKFSLDSKLIDVLPDKRIHENLFFNDSIYFLREVKIANLLNHTSGFPDYFLKNEADELAVHGDSSLTFTPIQLLSLAKRLDTTQNKPGEKFSYSNVNYILLGLIIEKYSGMTYYEYVQKNILDVLSLKNTYFISQRSAKNRTPGHYDKKPSQMPGTMAWSAGEIVSDLDDMQVFIRAWEKGKLFRNQATISTIKSAYFNDMGAGIKYGLGTINLLNLSFGHGGQTFGFSSYLGILSNGFSFVFGADDARDSAWEPAIGISSLLIQLK